MTTDSRLLRQNPWWTTSDWAVSDPHLRRLRAQPVQLAAPLVARLDIQTPGLHTLRGPRQVGKSTDLKLLVRRALEAGREPRSVVYLALDLLEGQPPRALATAIEGALQLSGAGGPRLLLLDEVSAVSGWQTALKLLWDDGLIDRDVVVCTGSSALDLARGTAERLPGRRGAGQDHLVLPQSFAAFARALDPDLPEPPCVSVAEMLEPGGRRALEDARLHAPRLQTALVRYLAFGGLPAAVAEAAAGAAEPSEEARRILWDSLQREVRREGASLPALDALLERAVRSLGSKTNWSRLAAEMAVPSARGGTADYRSVRDYVEVLAAAYFLLVVYFWRPDADSNAISKDKKLYLGDPLLHAVARDRAPGLSIDEPALVENAVAMALFRRYEPLDQQFEGFLTPRDLHVWGSARGGEIDFVCGPRQRIEAVEVKYRVRVDRRSAVAVSRAFPGRPAVVVTRDELRFTPTYALIPAGLFLWALG